MARFNQTAPYAGKGQKDLPARVAALAKLGVVITERNANHPKLFSRTAVVIGEKQLGVTWFGQNDQYGAGYFVGGPGNWQPASEIE